MIYKKLVTDRLFGLPKNADPRISTPFSSFMMAAFWGCWFCWS